MTLSEYLGRRENILSRFECSINVAIKIQDKMKDNEMKDNEWFINTVKKCHSECADDLKIAGEEFFNKYQGQDPFKNEEL